MFAFYAKGKSLHSDIKRMKITQQERNWSFSFYSFYILISNKNLLERLYFYVESLSTDKRMTIHSHHSEDIAFPHQNHLTIIYVHKVTNRFVWDCILPVFASFQAHQIIFISISFSRMTSKLRFRKIAGTLQSDLKNAWLKAWFCSIWLIVDENLKVL